MNKTNSTRLVWQLDVFSNFHNCVISIADIQSRESKQKYWYDGKRNNGMRNISEKVLKMLFSKNYKKK